MEKAAFDKNATIEENFPKVFRPNDEDTFMLDCKINVDDKTTPIKLSLIESELKRFYLNDHYQICKRILDHSKDMVAKGLV